MQEFIDFVLVAGNVYALANLISFFGFCLALGAIVMIAQALLSAGGTVRR